MSNLKHEKITNVLVTFELLQSLLLRLMGNLMNDVMLVYALFGDFKTPFNIITKYFKCIYEYKITEREHLTLYKDIFKRLEKCSNYRNEVAHSGMILTFDDETNKIIEKKITNSKDGQEWTMTKLEEYSLYIIETAKLINHLIDSIEEQ